MYFRTANLLPCNEWGPIDADTAPVDEENPSPHQLKAELIRPPFAGGSSIPVHPIHFSRLGIGEVGDKVRQLEEA